MTAILPLPEDGIMLATLIAGAWIRCNAAITPA
jgi:hypothetical protein